MNDKIEYNQNQPKTVIFTYKTYKYYYSHFISKSRFIMP